MTRLALCVALAVGWLVFRHAPIPAIVTPAAPAAVPIAELSAVAATVSKADRAALSETYLILSRSIAANPAVDPVFPDTAAVRRAHRAALLAVWKGVMGNDTGKYPGLKEALEGYLDKALGREEVILNPGLQETVAKTFSDMSAHFR